MSTVQKLLVVFGRLPLLFMVDIILRKSLMDFTEFPVDSLSQDYQQNLIEGSITSSQNNNTFTLLLLLMLLYIAALSSLILLCIPIEHLVKIYGGCLAAGLLIFSYHCNDHHVHGPSSFSLTTLKKPEAGNTSEEHQQHSFLPHQLQRSSVLIYMLTQFLTVLLFGLICIPKTLSWNKFTWYARYPLDIALCCSSTMPIILYSLLGSDNILYDISPVLGLVHPLLLLVIHLSSVSLTIMRIIFQELKNIRNNFREIGFDGLLFLLMEKTNLSWLLRIFFLTKVIYLVFTSKVLLELDEFYNLNWSEVLSTFTSLVSEVLHSMCCTILSVMSMASIVSIISGFCLNLVYRIIGANDDEENLQPAVSGFLFVLLAMQTGITSIASESKLQLLFQNCILLVVANQHFVQTVAADLVLKASTDDIALVKHVRPMLPYVIFFLFPFLVVVRLWEYPFRMSWLLAISAFSLELIIKSVGTLLFYTLNMLQTHTNYLHDSTEDLSFYIKAVCGCLEFICGIFLFLNGAYIFLFESGGIIRLVMMIIHFYCNIYQTAIKGLTAYRLRLSAWKKMNSFQVASQEQLDQNDDVCPVCYQEMTEAVVMKCSHVFHRGCLQKWLTIQEKCPLCHVDLSEENTPNLKKANE